MHALVFGNEFLKSARKLEKKIRANLDVILKLLSENYKDSKIHSKPLRGKLAGFYSLRVGRDHRVVYKFLNDSTILLTIVAHRSGAYR